MRNPFTPETPVAIRYMTIARFRTIVEPLGYTLRVCNFDCGTRVYVDGDDLPFLFSGVSEDGDNWTAAGQAFAAMVNLGLVAESMVEDN